MFYRSYVAIVSCLLFLHNGLCYAYKDDIGYTKLSMELGVNLPNGSGVRVSQSEADTDGVSGPPYNYLPDTSNSQFLGKTIIDVTNLTNQPSSHATSVGGLFYGSNSMANGIAEIYAYEVNNWLQPNYLRFGYISEPLPLSSPGRIGNHSWIGATADLSYDSDILRRLDWVIETDEFLQFVGTKNSTGLNSNLLSGAYNVIAVGKTNGLHSTGSAQIDSTYVSDRARTEIVAPLSVTSTATPVVAATAAILIETGHSNPGLSNGSTSNRNGDTIYNAERSETIKASLLAGADRLTKNTSTTANISDYRVNTVNQTDNGLDVRFGAGQVNVYNSYHIIAVGEQNSNEDDGQGSGSIGVYGFDYDPSFGGSGGSNNSASYYFSTGTNPGILSASLVWNIDIAGGSTAFDGAASFYDLDLMLYDITDGQMLLISSESNIDNSENIWTSLQAERDYLLQVIPNGRFRWDYALAWRIASDIDGDVISDEQDNCPGISNADQVDQDDDGIGDACDADVDGDGVTNIQDNCPIIFNADQADLDADGIGNVCDDDTDGDGLTNTDENNRGTDSLNPDSDADGLSDGDEVNVYITNPLFMDTDSDGLNDGDEVLVYSTSPNASNVGDLAPRNAANNVLNTADFLILFRLIGQLDTATAYEQTAGDINLDGVLDVRDAVLLRQMIGL